MTTNTDNPEQTELKPCPVIAYPVRVEPEPGYEDVACILDANSVLVAAMMHPEHAHEVVTIMNSRVSASSAAPVVDKLQRRLYEECIAANWDPEKRNTFAEEIAHLHEELSEAFRAWRRYKDCEIREVNGKLEGVPIEFADALIGMFYNAELHGFDLLAAIERKHQFNLTRNYVAEGRQLHPAAASPAAPTPCPNCGGSGEIEIGCAMSHALTAPCVECGGTGIASPAAAVEGGRSPNPK